MRDILILILFIFVLVFLFLFGGCSGVYEIRIPEGVEDWPVPSPLESYSQAQIDAYFSFTDYVISLRAHYKRYGIPLGSLAIRQKRRAAYLLSRDYRYGF